VFADDHPNRDELEAYAMSQLSEPDLERIETHLLRCEHCQDALSQADEYIRSIRTAAALSNGTARCRSIHFTEDGPIFGASHERADGKWLARHWGRQLQGMRVCDTLEEANAYLIDSFRQMFPDHDCSVRCIEEFL